MAPCGVPSILVLNEERPTAPAIVVRAAALPEGKLLCLREPRCGVQHGLVASDTVHHG